MTINQLNTNMDKNMESSPNNIDTERKPDEQSGIHVQGHIKIFDPESGEIYVDKRNAIHY
jgi:hypothetical protein